MVYDGNMQTRNELRKIVEKALKKQKISLSEFQILRPKGEKHGDYSLNIALEVGKKEKKDPLAIAGKLKSELEKQGKKIIKKVEVLPPGFINIFLKDEYLKSVLEEIIKEGKKFGSLEIGKGKSIQVEFLSANPTGPLTIGNARGGPFGDTLANVLKKAGYLVEKAYYINDYGNQINVLGHSVLKDDQAKYRGEYIDFLHERIGKESDAYKIGKWAAYIILKEMIKSTVEKLNIHYDEWFSETWLYDNKRVEKVLSFLEKKGFTYEKDGAVWLKAVQFGDIRDRVLVKKDGNATYLAGDIAYHEYKFKDKKFDKAINVWGADHAGDVKGLESGIEALGYKDRLQIVLLQFVTLYQKGEKTRMSKREGVYVTMDDLLNDIPTDVVRFFFLQKSFNTHLNFDLELALDESEKNPVYYVQYAYARICSVLRNADAGSIKKSKYGKYLKEEAEINLLKEFFKFEENIEDVALDFGVHKLTQYAIDLASAFHKFYSECKIIGEDKKLTGARLELCMATKIVLKNILDILGVSAPEKM